MEEEVVDDIIRLHAAGLAKFFDLEGIKSRMTPFQEGENDEDIPVMTTPSSTTAACDQVMKGLIMRSHAKKLKQQVNSLLNTFDASINENFILPKCSTLVVLRCTHEDKEKDRTTRSDHQKKQP